MSLNLLKVFIFPLAKNVHFDLEMHLDFVNKAFNPGSGCTIVKLLIQWLFVLLVTIFTIISIVISEKPCQTLGTCFLQSLLFLLILVLLSVNSIAPVLTNTQQFFIFLLGPQFVLFFLLGAQLVLFFLLGAQLVLFCLFGNSLGLLNSFELSCSIRISLILWLDRIILINNMLNIISITTSSAQNVNSLYSVIDADPDIIIIVLRPRSRSDPIVGHLINVISIGIFINLVAVKRSGYFLYFAFFIIFSDEIKPEWVWSND